MKLVSLLLFLSFLLTACAGESALVKKAQSSDNSGVSSTVKPELSPEKGYADLTVTASLKTHAENEFDSHGSADYQLLVNLDGEPVRLSGVRRREADGDLPDNHPEAGEGVRYRFQTHLRLKSGAHRIIVSLPEDNIAVQREIFLPDMTDSVLDIKPSYFKDRRRTGPGSAGATSFKEGIFGIELFLNGKEL